MQGGQDRGRYTAPAPNWWSFERHILEARSFGQRLCAGKVARGDTEQFAVGVDLLQSEAGPDADLPALSLRNALFEMLLMKGDLKEADLTDALFQAIATMPVDDSFTPEILAQKLREALERA